MPRSTSEDIELSKWPHVTFSDAINNTPSRASSIYSRPITTAEQNQADIRCYEECGKLPKVHDLDRRIAEMGGSTIGLETLTSRIQKTKQEQPLSPEQRRRELLWHQHESRFYERCGGIFCDLRAAVEDISQDLTLQSYVESNSAGNHHFRGCLIKLRVALDRAKAELVDAEREYKAFWAQDSGSTWV